MRIPDFLLAELNELLGPDRAHLLASEAELEVIGLDPFDRLALACAIDEALLKEEILDVELENWNTINDVVESAIRREPDFDRA